MKYIDIVFDGPPGADGGRFVEVEDHRGKSTSVGEWLTTADGRYHILRIMQPLTLAEVLSTQLQLQARMGWPTGSGEAGAKENLLHVMVEAVEAMREINFKPWKGTVKHVDLCDFATELTDVLQFLANAALSMSITADDLEAALRAKWEVNHNRITAGEVKSV